MRTSGQPGVGMGVDGVGEPGQVAAGAGGLAGLDGGVRDRGARIEPGVERLDEGPSRLVADRPEAADEGRGSAAQEGLRETAHLRPGRGRLAQAAGVDDDDRSGRREGQRFPLGQRRAQVVEGEGAPAPAGGLADRLSVRRQQHLADRRDHRVVGSAVAREVQQVDLTAAEQSSQATAAAGTHGARPERREVGPLPRRQGQRQRRVGVARDQVVGRPGADLEFDRVPGVVDPAHQPGPSEEPQPVRIRRGLVATDVHQLPRDVGLPGGDHGQLGHGADPVAQLVAQVRGQHRGRQAGADRLQRGVEGGTARQVVRLVLVRPPGVVQRGEQVGQQLDLVGDDVGVGPAEVRQHQLEAEARGAADEVLVDGQAVRGEERLHPVGDRGRELHVVVVRRCRGLDARGAGWQHGRGQPQGGQRLGRVLADDDLHLAGAGVGGTQTEGHERVRLTRRRQPQLSSTGHRLVGLRRRQLEAAPQHRHRQRPVGPHNDHLLVVGVPGPHPQLASTEPDPQQDDLTQRHGGGHARADLRQLWHRLDAAVGGQLRCGLRHGPRLVLVLDADRLQLTARRQLEPELRLRNQAHAAVLGDDRGQHGTGRGPG